jgi:hypothetical protein
MTGDVADLIHIVVAFPDGFLPSVAFQAVKRARRVARQAGFRARIELLPESALPLLDAAPEVLHVTAGTGPSDGRDVEPHDVGPALDQLIERLVAAGRLRRGPELPRTVAVHRGLQPVHGRARMGDERGL